MRILVVEDEFIIAEDIRQILKSLGHEVVGVAMNYTQALDILEKHTIDMALIDIILGGSKTGIELAQFIKERYGFPFIFLTSHADAATVKKAKAVQPSGYLLKPFNKNDLFTTLEIADANNDTSRQVQQRLSTLSDREQEVYDCLVKGHTDQEIADQLFVSLNTVKTHLKHIYKKA